MTTALFPICTRSHKNDIKAKNQGALRRPFLLCQSWMFLREDCQEKQAGMHFALLQPENFSLLPTLPPSSCQIGSIQPTRDQMPVATGFAESFLITSICSIFQRQINSQNALLMVMTLPKWAVGLRRELWLKSDVTKWAVDMLTVSVKLNKLNLPDKPPSMYEASLRKWASVGVRFAFLQNDNGFQGTPS